MKQLWERFAGRVDALNIRERSLLFAVLVIGIVAFSQGVVFKSMVDQQKRLVRQMEEDRKVTATIQAQIEKMVSAVPDNPDAENRAKVAKLTSEAEAAEQAVKNLQKGLVSPDQIGQVLEGIINRQRGLRLVSLKKLPLESLALTKPSADSAKDAKAATSVAGQASAATSAQAPAMQVPTESIYKHSVQVVVEGQYFDVLDYLASLEKLPYQVFWGKARLQVGEYPKTTLTLDVFTLSLEKKWLSI